jgi:hypothetical protein
MSGDKVPPPLAPRYAETSKALKDTGVVRVDDPKADRVKVTTCSKLLSCKK